MKEEGIQGKIIELFHILNQFMPSENVELITAAYSIGNESRIVDRQTGDRILEAVRDLIDQYDDCVNEILGKEYDDALEDRQHHLREIAEVDNEFKIELCNTISIMLQEGGILG
jgi:hypothetical protein